MKPHVLFATQDRGVRRHFQAELADLCSVNVSASPGQVYSRLRQESFQAVIVDSRLPQLDSVQLIHALRHAPTPSAVFISWGPINDALYLSDVKTWRSLVIRRSREELVATVRAQLDPAAARTIREVRYDSAEDSFFIAFRDGKTYELSRKVIEADDETRVTAARVVDGGDAFEVTQASGNTYDVAWDFILYHQEPSYPYHKARPAQRAAEADRAERIGARVRQHREARGWSLADVASRAGMHVPNLSRLESGKHVPSLETLERVAEALGVRVVDLVAAR